jgi:cytochrome b subunit of formate dehydrogenase
MFRSIAITGFIVVIAGIILHFIASKQKFDDVFGKDRAMRILDPLRLLVFFMSLLFVEQKWSLVGVLRKLVFLLAILCFAVLVVTGFTPMIFLGKTITSWWLMVHATFAPVFAVCLAALAVLWADKNRFDKNYWPWLNRALQRQPKSTQPAEKYELMLKISFWAVLILSLPMILTAVLGTFPLFCTYWEGVLLQLHRYSTLLLSLFAIIYLYLAAMMEMNRTAAK